MCISEKAISRRLSRLMRRRYCLRKYKKGVKMVNEELAAKKYIKQYAWKGLHKSNLEEIVSICDFIIENYDCEKLQTVISALYKYSILSFVKEFTPTKASCPLDHKYIKNLDGDAEKVFEYYKKLRNKYIAHNESIYDLVALSIKEDRYENAVYVHVLRKLFDNIDHIVQFKKMNLFIIKSLENELIEDNSKIIMLANKYPKYFLHSKSKFVISNIDGVSIKGEENG